MRHEAKDNLSISSVEVKRSYLVTENRTSATPQNPSFTSR